MEKTAEFLSTLVCSLYGSKNSRVEKSTVVSWFGYSPSTVNMMLRKHLDTGLYVVTITPDKKCFYQLASDIRNRIDVLVKTNKKSYIDIATEIAKEKARAHVIATRSTSPSYVKNLEAENKALRAIVASYKRKLNVKK